MVSDHSWKKDAAEHRISGYTPNGRLVHIDAPTRRGSSATSVANESQLDAMGEKSISPPAPLIGLADGLSVDGVQVAEHEQARGVVAGDVIPVEITYAAPFHLLGQRVPSAPSAPSA
jgi:hypothetical protein